MAKIITYHGSEDALVWLKERKGMDSETELVVPFAHEAIFVKNGKMMDCFSTGRYNLSECAVGEGRLYEEINEKIDCRIYYVKKEGGYGIKLAPAMLSIFDPVLKKEADLDLSVSFSIKIIDSKQFLSKMLSNTSKASLQEIKTFFRGRMLVYIKDHLVDVMEENGIKSSELNDKLIPISTQLQLKMRYVFENYGVSIEDFKLKNARALCFDGEPVKSAPKRKENNKCEEGSVDMAIRQCDKDEVKGEAMYCPKCGLDVPPLSVFCNKCGQKI